MGMTIAFSQLYARQSLQHPSRRRSKCRYPVCNPCTDLCICSASEQSSAHPKIICYCSYGRQLQVWVWATCACQLPWVGHWWYEKLHLAHHWKSALYYIIPQTPFIVASTGKEKLKNRIVHPLELGIRAGAPTIVDAWIDDEFFCPLRPQ